MSNPFQAIGEALEKINQGVQALKAGLNLLGTAPGRAEVRARLEAEDNIPAAATLRDLEQIVEASVAVASAKQESGS